jgi:hypothetical protein
MPRLISSGEKMSTLRLTRRTLTASAAGFAVGALTLPHAGVLAQDATPVGATRPLGYVSTRLRTVETAEQRDRVNELVQSDFLPDVEALEGFGGYVLGDAIDAPEQSLSILVLDEPSQAAAFDELAKAFVAGIEDEVVTVNTEQWAGNLMITGAPTATATPAATPVVPGPMTDGYVALRVHTSLPGTDPRDFVPLAIEGFLPIVEGIDGFRGYLWYPTDGGFVAISLFDSEAAATASNEAAKEWAAEFLADYTDGKPEIVNANVVHADLPILG